MTGRLPYRIAKEMYRRLPADVFQEVRDQNVLSTCPDVQEQLYSENG